ncbi:MAG TPA: hypothetical protein VFU10_06045 [Gaiellaceae bacterium]|nr:hypothetical protein [Gaiellaceae bacterium]
MLERIRNWFRPTPSTNEDLEAAAEGQHIREEVESLRTGAFTGPTVYTHGGSESRHGFDE